MQRAVARNDPWGLDVRWDIGGPAAVNFVRIRLLDDGRPGWPMGIEGDYRTTKGFRVKPEVEGVYDLLLEVEDVRGRCNFVVSTTKITVVK